MDLLNSFAVIVLTLFMIHYVMVNVLNIPFKDLVRAPGIVGNHGLNNVKVDDKVSQSQSQSQRPELAGMEAELKASFGVGEIGSGLPDPFRIQAVYDPERDRNYPVAAANEEIYEKEAEFGNEQTNVSQFFALNPGAFFNDQRHNAYVPDVSTWNHGGQQLFSQMVNAPRQLLQASNFDKHYDPV